MHDLADLAVSGQGVGILENGGCGRTAVAPVLNLEHRPPLGKAGALLIVLLATVTEPVQSLRLREISNVRQRGALRDIMCSICPADQAIRLQRLTGLLVAIVSTLNRKGHPSVICCSNYKQGLLKRFNASHAAHCTVAQQ